MIFCYRLKIIAVLLNLLVLSGSHCLAWQGDCLLYGTFQEVGSAAGIQELNRRLQDSENPELDPSSQWNELVRAAKNLESPSIQIRRFVVGFQHLAQLSNAGNLAELLLDAGKIDDRGAKEIARHCPQLEHLRLRFSPIGDSGAECIAKLKHLRILNLPHSRLSSRGIEHLKAVPNLELLRLGGSSIDDRAVAEIAGLPKLESLHLIGPSLTEKSLDLLANAPRLTSLYLDGCQLADEAWVRFNQKRPDLHVHLDQNHADRQNPPSQN